MALKTITNLEGPTETTLPILAIAGVVILVLMLTIVTAVFQHATRRRQATLEALKGTYASTGQQTCLSTDSKGFNSGLQPMNPATSTIGSVGFSGLYAFDDSGKVTVDWTYVSYSGPSFTGSGEIKVVTNANNGTFSVEGSYTAEERSQ